MTVTLRDMAMRFACSRWIRWCAPRIGHPGTPTGGAISAITLFAGI